MRLSWLAVFSVLILGCNPGVFPEPVFEDAGMLVADSTYLTGSVDGREWQLRSGSTMLRYWQDGFLNFSSEDFNNALDTQRSIDISLLPIDRVGTALLHPSSTTVFINYRKAIGNVLIDYRAVSGRLSITTFDTSLFGRIDGEFDARFAGSNGDTIELTNIRFGGIGFHRSP